MRLVLPEPPFSREQQEGEEEEEEEVADAEVLLLFGRRYFLFLDSLQFEGMVNTSLHLGGHCGRAGRKAEDSGGMSCRRI